MGKIILNEDKFRGVEFAFSVNYLLADELVSSSYGLLLAPQENLVCSAYHSTNHLAYPANKNISRCVGTMIDMKKEQI